MSDRRPAPIPFVDLTRLEPGFMEAWLERVRAITARTAFVGGEWVARLEERLALEAGVAHAVGCANGTDALQLALRALGVGPGDRVLLPDLTFWATLEAVVNVGARPVTVDANAVDLQMDLAAFQEAAARHRPKAAILAHLYGWASGHLGDFRDWCGREGILLLEDGAQSWGARRSGLPLPAGALVSTVSFYPAKVLGAAGDAGAVLTDDADLARRLRQLGNHGRASHDAHDLVGWNSRLDALDAAWLDLCLDHLPERVASRRRTAATYRAALADLPGWRMVGPPEGITENGYLSVALVDPRLRDALAAALAGAGVATGRVYPRAISEQAGAAAVLTGSDDGDGGGVARGIGAGIINLPLFAHMRAEEVERVAAAVVAALRELPREAVMAEREG
jgi:UDP-2-acetamido-2-deoxy-ribo-hexuluronate aminotransferase